MFSSALDQIFRDPALLSQPRTCYIRIHHFRFMFLCIGTELSSGVSISSDFCYALRCLSTLPFPRYPVLVLRPHFQILPPLLPSQQWRKKFPVLTLFSVPRFHTLSRHQTILAEILGGLLTCVTHCSGGRIKTSLSFHIGSRAIAAVPHYLH